MTAPETDLDKARDRWQRKRESLGFPDTIGTDPGPPNGLAGRVEDITTRILILPADPFRTEIDFDEDFWSWWEEDRSAPFSDTVPWQRDVVTVEAAVKARGYNGVWKAYLGLHRCGGIEIGARDTYTLGDESKCFRLARTVGFVWLGLDTQAFVLNRFDLPGPWEITIVLHGTEDAYLGDLAEGWAQPEHLGTFDPPRCRESNVVVRREIEVLPTAPEAVQNLAFDLGGRIENAWGMRERRFIAKRGDLEGEFDHRSWRF